MKLFKTFCLIGSFGVLSIGWATAAKAQGKLNQTQQGQGANAGNQAQRGFNGGIHQMPWFGNPTVRQQMQLNDEQFSS